MTAVPPPVPPEIVEKAAKAAWSQSAEEFGAGITWDQMSDAVRTMLCDRAEKVLASVYGDIVEAARRDALESAMEGNALARAVGWDDGYLQGRRDALTEAARVIGDEAAADGVYGTDVQGGLLRAGWIVGNMARHGLSASVSDQGADPRTPTTPGAQIGVQSDD